MGIPNILGVPEDFAKHTMLLRYNDIKGVEEIAKRYHKDLAAIIVEPVSGNCGVILPQPGFLQGLRKVANRYNLLLIFDEVITGFRLSYGGAQTLFDIKPDLTCLGKIIGGGLPVGAFGGKREIMQLLAPQGGVYQAGTLSGNPIAVTAGIATLKMLKGNSSYKVLGKQTKELCEGIKLRAKKYSIGLKVNYIGSMFSIFFATLDSKHSRSFTGEGVTDFGAAKTQNASLFRKFFHSLLKEGVYFSPSGFEANFLSAAHNGEDIKRTLEVIDNALENLPCP